MDDGRQVIYVLMDPRTKEVRYVGKTKDPHIRLRGHQKVCRLGHRNQSHLVAWLRSLGREDLYPLMENLVTVPPPEANDAERFWIRTLREAGIRLVNGTAGGDGGNTRPPGWRMPTEWRQKIGDAQRGKSVPHRGRPGKVLSPEVRAKIAASWIERRKHPEVMKAVGEKRRGQPHIEAKYRCGICGLLTHAGPLANHQRVSGHSGYTTPNGVHLPLPEHDERVKQVA